MIDQSKLLEMAREAGIDVGEGHYYIGLCEVKAVVKLCTAVAELTRERCAVKAEGFAFVRGGLCDLVAEGIRALDVSVKPPKDLSP